MFKNIPKSPNIPLLKTPDKYYVLAGVYGNEHAFIRCEGKEVTLGLVIDKSVGTDLPISLETTILWIGPAFKFSRAFTVLFGEQDENYDG